MKKRLTTSIAAVAVMLSATIATQAFASAPFSDIASLSSKAKIESLQQQGIIKGVSDTSFNPEDKLTAAQGISLIVRATQISLAAIDFSSAPTADGFYKHVKNDAWYAEDFIIAHYNGLDIPADIDPNATLTKEQFTHYLVQALELTGQYPTIKMFIQIKDEKAIKVDYQGTIQRALLYRIISLDDAGNFEPTRVLTRAEAAAILYDAHSFIQAHKDDVAPDPAAPETTA